MLNVVTTILTNTALAGDSMTTVALVLGALALLVALIALSKARRAGSQGSGDSVATTVAAGMPAAAMAGAAGMAGAADVSDDRQLVAVITAAIAAMLESEAQAGSTSGSVRLVRSARSSVNGGAGAGTGTGTGPYAGFVVRRIRRV